MAPQLTTSMETPEPDPMVKPAHADPAHPSHEAYRPELDDYPQSEAEIEAKWRAEGGIDENGQMWLTPRMNRNASRLVELWRKPHEQA